MKVHDPPGKWDVFSWGEAEGFHNLDCLKIKIRITGGSGGNDVRNSAIRADPYKKRCGIERVGVCVLRAQDFAGWLREACGEFR
jgi:hypothetical protein